MPRKTKKKPGDDFDCRHRAWYAWLLEASYCGSTPYQPLAQKIVNSTRRFISLPSFVAFVVR